MRGGSASAVVPLAAAAASRCDTLGVAASGLSTHAAANGDVSSAL